MESRTRKKRQRNLSLDDRARHSVMERERREAFNKDLVTLARFLPALGDTKDNLLSKRLVVAESIKQHEAQHAEIESLRCELTRAKNNVRQLRDQLSNKQQPAMGDEEQAWDALCETQQGHSRTTATFATSGYDQPSSDWGIQTQAMPGSQVHDLSSFGKKWEPGREKRTTSDKDLACSDAFPILSDIGAKSSLSYDSYCERTPPSESRWDDACGNATGIWVDEWLVSPEEWEMRMEQFETILPCYETSLTSPE